MRCPWGTVFHRVLQNGAFPQGAAFRKGLLLCRMWFLPKKKISSSMGHNSCPEPLLLHGLSTGYSTDICTETILCAAAGQPASPHCSLQPQNHCSISWSTSFPLPLTSVPAGLFLSYIPPSQLLYNSLCPFLNILSTNIIHWLGFGQLSSNLP